MTAATEVKTIKGCIFASLLICIFVVKPNWLPWYPECTEVLDVVETVTEG